MALKKADKDAIIHAVGRISKCGSRRSKRIMSDFAGHKINKEEFNEMILIECHVKDIVTDCLNSAGLGRDVEEMNQILGKAIIAGDAEKVHMMASCGLLALNEFGYSQFQRAGHVHPLHLAAHHNQPEIIRIVFSKQPDRDIDESVNNQMTPLMMASIYGSVNAGRTLIELGANVNAVDISKKTPLIFSAWYGQLEFARLLLQSGANRGLKDRGGSTAEEYAVRYNNLDIVQLIREWA